MKNRFPAVFGLLVLPLLCTAEPAATRARTNLPVLPLALPSTCTLTASPTAILVNQCTTLNMTIAGVEWATKATLNGAPVTLMPHQANYSADACVGPAAGTFTYNASVEGPGGVGNCLATVTSTLPPPPTCTLGARPSPMLYNCSQPVSGVTLTLSPSGFFTSASIEGTPGTSTSRWWVWPWGHTFNGSVSSPSGSNACSVHVGVQCLNSGVIVEDHRAIRWGWRQGANNPPTCDYDYHCMSSSCARDTGGWIAKRGCSIPGCLAPQSLLVLGDGTLKRADQVQQGDSLWNPIRKKAFAIRSMVVGPEERPLLRIGFGDTAVTVTDSHPLFTRDGLKTAEQVGLHDFILGSDLKYHKVAFRRVLPLKPEQTVYNFILFTESDSEDDHVILADGIIVGDHYLQTKLQRKAIR